VAKADHSQHNAAKDAAPPKSGGMLRRAAGRLFASRLRAVLVLLAAVGIIGVAAWGALAFSRSSQIPFAQRLAQAFAELDKGHRQEARRLAAALLRDSSASYAEYGGAYYILGSVTLHDADDQINPSKRQVLDLVAARYLEEARIRGIPEGRQDEGQWLLGRALHDAGRFERSISILREALESQPANAPQLHWLLADGYLNVQPPKLAEALDHNRQYLAARDLTPREQDAGRLVEARILLAQRETDAAGQAIAPIGPQSPLFPEAVILRGRILLEALAGAKTDDRGAFAERIGSMREQLAGLVAREGLAAPLAAQVHMVLALLYENMNDERAAIVEFDLIRRSFFGQPEALAAILFHGDLVRRDSPREAVALYKRALALLPGDGTWQNSWLPAEQFRTRLAAAIDDLASRGHFAEAIELAESLVEPFSHEVAVERRVTIQRSWARQLEERARGERQPEAGQTEAEARRHWREAGALGRQLADMRLASRYYLDDLAHAADDFRHGQGYEQAVVVFRELLRQEPQQREPDALVGLGESLVALGKLDAALPALARCREAYPKHPATYQARLLASLALQQQGKLDEAKELLVDNLYRFSLAPQSAEWRESLFALGRMLYRHALELEARSRQAGVDRAENESRRAGLVLLEQSQAAFEEAISTFSQAVERYPTAPQTVEALYRIAESHRHSAKLPRKRLSVVTIASSKAALRRQMEEQLLAAIDGYSSLITRLSNEQHPHRWPTEAVILRNCYFGRADALFDLERYDQAIQAYSAATNRYQHDPESLEAYVQIASCHRRLGRLSEARGTLEQARVVLQRIRSDADFTRTTRLARKDWTQLLDWLRTL
jgi:tetratricopeptide (TPR) repeat protein